MFESLFGTEMPLAVRFFLAFLVVLGLIGAIAWVVRRFGAGRLGGGAARGRQPRLAVIDHASVDGRRRLVLVRRDNVEHLLMIGGPSDVVVEANIVRAAAQPREAAPPRSALGVESLPRTLPLPEGGNGSWPLQPEPAPIPRAPVRPEPRSEAPTEEPASWLPPHSETPSRPQRDTLAALADELSSRQAALRRGAPPSGRPAPTEPRSEARTETRSEPRPEPRPPELRPEPRVEIRAVEVRSEPPVETRPEPRAESRPEPRPAAPPAPVAEPVPAPSISTSDESLADMAQRLEAALRKPSAPLEPKVEPRSEAKPLEPRPIAMQGRPTPPAEPAEPAAAADAVPPPPSPLRTLRPPEPPKPPRTEIKPNQNKSVYDSLEQEMANLLGRPTKT